MTDSFPSRLNKYLALHTGTSRRQADDLIAQGRVTVNGAPAIIGARVNQNDNVHIDGHPVIPDTAFLYIALNKPTGYVCSRKRQGDNPTIYKLLPKEYHSLKPVGRLDRNSSGLILLTNDGNFALQMTHPSYHKVKQYDVTIDKPLEPLHQQMISDFGVNLDDGKSQLILERISDDRTTWKVTMTEGRNRQIRRTFAALGYTVTKLHRTHFGKYLLESPKTGSHWLVHP